MASELLVKKIQNLSDLELAILTCFIAQEHCIINTLPVHLDKLIRELELVTTKTFGIRCVVVIECCRHTSVDEFDHALLCREGIPLQANSPARSGIKKSSCSPTFSVASRPLTTEKSTDQHLTPNVIIAKNLDKASQQIQLRALQLIKTKQIDLKTNILHASQPCIFIAVLAGEEVPRLDMHLNDAMFFSHSYCPEDHLPMDKEQSDDEVSNASVVKRSPTNQPPEKLIEPIISAQEIEDLTKLSKIATFSIEVKRYQMNIISFIRMHRAVAGGVTAVATKHFDKLARCLASLHNLSYVSPSLVGLAARKIYIHRIKIVEPESERSMQWGSDLLAVTELLDGMGAEEVLEDVLGNSGAEAPL